MNCKIILTNNQLYLVDTSYGMHYQAKYFNLHRLDSKNEPINFISNIPDESNIILEEFQNLFYYLSWKSTIQTYQRRYPEYFI